MFSSSKTSTTIATQGTSSDTMTLVMPTINLNGQVFNENNHPHQSLRISATPFAPRVLYPLPPLTHGVNSEPFPRFAEDVRQLCQYQIDQRMKSARDFPLHESGSSRAGRKHSLRTEERLQYFAKCYREEWQHVDGPTFVEEQMREDEVMGEGSEQGGMVDDLMTSGQILKGAASNLGSGGFVMIDEEEEEAGDDDDDDEEGGVLLLDRDLMDEGSYRQRKAENKTAMAGGNTDSMDWEHLEGWTWDQ